MGWSLSDRHLEGNNINETDKQKIQKQRSGIKSYDDYAALNSMQKEIEELKKQLNK